MPPVRVVKHLTGLGEIAERIKAGGREGNQVERGEASSQGKGAMGQSHFSRNCLEKYKVGL